jgi:hypothetical protein
MLIFNIKIMNKKRIAILILFALFLFVGANIVYAGCGAGQGSCVSLRDPLGGQADNPNVLIGRIIKAALGLVGSLALLMFVYGGFTWMLSAGNSEKVQKGKQIFIWATVGLLVIFAAYGIVRFLFTDVLGIK